MFRVEATDPAGRWTVRVTDVATGVAGAGMFELADE